MANDTVANDAASKPGLWGWINKRLPAESFIRSQLFEYFSP